MNAALNAGMESALISFAGPGKSVTEIDQAVAAGITVNLESAVELGRVEKAGKRLSLRPRVAVRVNPDFSLRASGMHMGGGAQQFGIDAARVPEILDRIGRADLDFQGFHIFAGSQNLRADLLIEAQAKTVDLALALAKRAPGPVRHINIGGGFGIPYFPNDRSLDLRAVGRALAASRDRVEAALPQARLVVELGRYIVGEAGVYVCRVVDRKTSGGETFLVTDGGLHHHLAVGQFRADHSTKLSARHRQPDERGTTQDSECRRAVMHAAGSPGVEGRLAAGPGRRSGRRVPVRRVWENGEPDSIPQSSRA